MNKHTRGWIFFVIILISAALLWLNTLRPKEQKVVEASMITSYRISSDGFSRAEKPIPLEFPLDMGPHEDYQTEWWYYTGNLVGEDGKRYGYQVTFFRRGLVPPEEITARPSDWATSQVYMAHFALTDVDGEAFLYEEQFARGAAGLAGATGSPLFAVFLNDWKVEQTGQNQYLLKAAQDGISLELFLTDQKGFVLQGDMGYSRKGEEAGNASYYVSQPRLATSGTIHLDGQTLRVSGESWMDHEWSTSALGSEQVGWDWYAIQLSDGSELMAFTLRRADGTLDPFSVATLIAVDGSTHTFGGNDFSIEPAGPWTSPHSGATYPSGWAVKIGSELDLQITPLTLDQELNVSFIYWEGAVKINGTHNGEPVSGQGYVELTGYAHTMQGEF
jgi:predicted secreted hydrolase